MSEGFLVVTENERSKQRRGLFANGEETAMTD